MFIRRSDDIEWESFGQKDPYFGVLTDKKYMAKNLDESLLEEFFKSGEDHLDSILATIKRTLNSNFSPSSCLDFGCGVGRLLLPMSKRFSRVIGVDVSKSMIKEAKKNCNKHGAINVELFESDDRLSNLSGKFDLIHSFTVFQHILPNRGEKIIRQLIDRLNEKGVFVLHVTYCWRAPLYKKWFYNAKRSIPFIYDLINLIKRRPLNYPFMRMYQYNLERIFSIFEENKFNEFFGQFTNHDGYLGIILFFKGK